MSDPREPDEHDALAAELALRLLDGDDLAAAAARAARDPEFASEVARWRGRLAPLDDKVEDVAPPPTVWRRIEATVQGRAAGNDSSLLLHRSVRRWRSATAVMTALAASLGFLLVRPGPPPALLPVSPPAAQPPAMVALVGDKEATKVLVSWDPARRQMVLAVADPLPADAQRSHELWVIPQGGTPRSLGTLSADRQSHKVLADALADLLQQGATIAISVEPRGGSPTGAPTGPVIATGALSPA